MEKYLIDPISLENHFNQVFCIDDYGVEGELFQKKWYDIISQTENRFVIKNEWGEILPYSKTRFRIQKQNLPLL